MWPKSALALLTLALLGATLALDILTPANLVVAILFNVPIALSSLLLSRNFTLTVMILALSSNLLAGFLNAQIPGSSDLAALLNRLFSALSFVLVGFLTLRLRSSVARVARLSLEESRAERERNLRQLLTTLSGSRTPEVFLEGAAAGLRDYLDAKAVVIVGLEHPKLERPKYAPPRYSSPPGATLAGLGASVPDLGASLEAVWPRPDGSELRVLVGGANVGGANVGRDALEDAVGAVAPVFEQLVLRRKLEAQHTELERRNDLIKDLIYAFSHDLRTPITASTLSMKLALQGVYGEMSPEYKSALENGLTSNAALLDLADQLLTVARLEAGEAGDDFRPLELRGLLEARIAQVRGIFAEKSLELRCHLALTAWVRGNPLELGRAVQNLLENAFKWSPQGGVVEVRLETLGRFGHVTVLDDGPGVPEAVRPTLFQRFKKAGAGAGSGLGLYLARRIVEAHGGRIAYARLEGRTSFRFSLPLVMEPPDKVQEVVLEGREVGK